MSILATKTIEQIKDEQLGGPGLKRVLGPTQLMMLGVGAIIGTGIFVLTGQAAAANAGPAIVISMVVAGLVSALAALCYSEFAASVPVAGSAYTYAYATLGEFVAWVIGWDLILEYALGAATVAVGWSGNFITFLHQLGLSFPAALSAAPGTIVPVPGGDPVTAVFNIPAVLVTIAVTALLVVGVSESATANAVVVVIKVAVVLIVIASGALFIDRANWHPFIPANTGTFGEYGWSGILRGAGVIFFAYIGFDAVSTSAQEARNPQRDLPRGILGSLVICTVLYVLVSGVMVGLVPYKAMLNQPAPLVLSVEAAADRAIGTPWQSMMAVVRVLVTVGALAGLSSVMLVMMLAQPRIFLAMARDGLLPAWASRIHPRYHTPHISTIVTGVVVAIAAGLTPIATLGNLVSIGTLMAFVIVSLGVIVLRRTRPDLPRPFRMPLVPLLPLLSAAVSLLLMLGLPRSTWERLIIWMVIGVVLYFAYGYRRSRLRGVSRRRRTDRQGVGVVRASLESQRLESIDLLRGAIMIVMALDHTRDFFGIPGQNPTNLASASAALFLTRWITYYCAPVFFLLTGTGAYLSLRRRTPRELSWFLLTRGLWLIFLELVVVRALSYQFNLDFRMTMLVVLWALGWSMIVLGALVRLPVGAITAFGAILIAGHNLFDTVRSANPIWSILHSPGFVLNTPEHVVFVAYPLIPWIGVTAMGFALGQVYSWESERRRTFLLGLGSALTLGFLVIRGINAYGDAARWATQKSALFTALSFLNTTKYPPSLLFLLMTLGPMLIVLWAVDRGTPRALRPAVTIGKVPLFYYVLHFFLIHLLAVLVCYAQNGSAHWMFESPDLAHYPFSPPPGWGYTLPVVYLIWGGVVLAMYPLCRWFAGVKQRRKEPWFSYL